MDNGNTITAFLLQQLTDVYNKLKIESYDIDKNKLKYLDKISRICSIHLAAEQADETTIKSLAKFSATHLLEISKKGVLSESELDHMVYLINQKAKELVGIVDSDVQAEENKEDSTSASSVDAAVPFVKRELIPVGFEKNSPRISVEDFFSFPLGSKPDPTENERYEQHLRYLEESVEESILEEAVFEQIKQSLDTLPKYRYKKYFDVYPGDLFEEATLSMLYIKLKNRSLEKLRL